MKKNKKIIFAEMIRQMCYYEKDADHAGQKKIP